MIPFLVEMKKLHDETESDSVWRNDEYDPPTMSWNIGVNDHTKAFNVIPGLSVCTVYFRPMPGMDIDPLLERVQQAAEYFGLEFRIDSRDDPVSVDPDSTFVRELLRVAGKRASRTVSYCTDGAKFQAMKKLAVFGPGNVAQARTHDEWIALDQLEQGTEVYSKLIRHWCC
jgi:acetylornithine deacetylase